MGFKVGVLPVTPYQQNCSILICEKTNKAAVVDPGGDLDNILQIIENNGGTLEKIFITHGHMDHCAGAGELRERTGVIIEGPHKADSFWIDQMKPMCEMSGFPPADSFVPDRWLDEGDYVEFGEQRLEVTFCPGHTPGHIVFYNTTQQMAFVGDVLFQGSIGRTDFPMSDHQALIDSITNKLWPLGDEMTFIPGHGPNSTFGRERETNAFVADQRFG